MREQKTHIIGILNITPDSFSDGGLYYKNLDNAIARVKQMLREGADIIDVGGESTRPGSEFIDEAEEINRVLPVIKAIKNQLGDHISLSIDTNKAQVAEEALKSGASIVNTLGGFLFDSKLADVVARHRSQVIIYHIKGQPKTMQKGEIKYKDVITDISRFFTQQIMIGEERGIAKEKFILDPGIGFGKTMEQNIEIIQRLREFQTLNLPIAIGVSRKSHLAALLQAELKLPELPDTSERLEASLAETAVAVLHGAKFIRTHDVWQTKKFLTVLDKFTC
jgi:dihydropteroate synthase